MLTDDRTFDLLQGVRGMGPQMFTEDHKLEFLKLYAEQGLGFLDSIADNRN